MVTHSDACLDVHSKRIPFSRERILVLSVNSSLRVTQASHVNFSVCPRSASNKQWMVISRLGPTERTLRMHSSTHPWSPYHEAVPTVSRGRRSLVSAFSDLVRCQAGFEPYELPEIFAAPTDEGENDACKRLVELDAALLTTQFVLGKIGTFARPIGGGEIVAIPPEHWEIDDPLPRFATGSYNAADWANAQAPESHRIFVDTARFEEWLASLKPPGPLNDRELNEALDPQLRAARAVAARRVKAVLEPQKQRAEPDAASSLSQSLTAGDELLTLREVEALIKLKRSSIYAKIESDGFPKNILLGGRAVWKKSAVLAWVEEKAAQGRKPVD